MTNLQKWLLIGVSCLALAGCATANLTSYNKGSYPPTNPKDVKVFYSPPKMNYIEIGEITSKTFWKWQSGISYMKNEASKIGADGIIITNQDSNYITQSAIAIKLKE